MKIFFKKKSKNEKNVAKLLTGCVIFVGVLLYDYKIVILKIKKIEGTVCNNESRSSASLEQKTSSNSSKKTTYQRDRVSL